MGELVLEMLRRREAVAPPGRRGAAPVHRRAGRSSVDILDEEITRYLSDLSTEVLSRGAVARQVLAILLFITKDLELIADTDLQGAGAGVAAGRSRSWITCTSRTRASRRSWTSTTASRECAAAGGVGRWPPGIRELASAGPADRKQQLSEMERKLPAGSPQPVSRRGTVSPESHDHGARRRDERPEADRVAHGADRVCRARTGPGGVGSPGAKPREAWGRMSAGLRDPGGTMHVTIEQLEGPRRPPRSLSGGGWTTAALQREDRVPRSSGTGRGGVSASFSKKESGGGGVRARSRS